MLHAYKVLLAAFIHNPESAILKELVAFRDAYGTEVFHSPPAHLGWQLGAHVLYSSLLYFAAWKNYAGIVKKLIEFGLDVNDGLCCDTDDAFDRQSPLMVASEKNHYEIVQILLEAKANILHTSSFGTSVLMKAASEGICTLLIKEAQKNNCFNELVSFYDKENRTAWNYARIEKNKDVAVTILYHELATLYTIFLFHSEDEILKVLERFISMYQFSALPLHFPVPEGQNTCTLLYFAVEKNYVRLATRLIELGVHEDRSIDTRKFAMCIYLTSVLKVACRYGNIGLITLLIDAGAYLLCRSSEGNSLLMHARTADTVRLLLDKSIKKNQLTALLKARNYANVSVYRFHYNLGNSDILMELLQVFKRGRLEPGNVVLRYARLASITFQEKSAEFDKLCVRLQSARTTYPIQALAGQTVSVKLSNSYFTLFGERNNESKGSLSQQEDFAVQKEFAIKKALVDLYDLFQSPDDCISYLKHLNDELGRYFLTVHQQPFPSLESDSFAFEEIEGLYYPIPDEGYSGIKKYSALQELLIIILKQYNLAKNTYKWLGFIPSMLANEQVRAGDFVTEKESGPGLYHGKLAHMIQNIIFIYAYQDGKINSSFSFQGKLESLSIQDILAAHVSPIAVNGGTPWTLLRDSRQPTKAFSDPHSLTSFLMYEGKTIGCDYLCDYLTDSFCTGFVTFHTDYQRLTFFKTITAREFIGHSKDLTLAFFYSIPAFISTQKKRLLQKNLTVIDSSAEYAVIASQYSPRFAFEPRPFGAHDPDTSPQQMP